MAHLLYPERAQGLDGLLVVDPELKSSRLHWLVTAPVQASPTSVGGEVEKLRSLRGLGVDTLDMSSLPAERGRYLAQIGRRLTAQALVRREPNRRHPILLTLLAQFSVDASTPWCSSSTRLCPARSSAPGSSCARCLAAP
ncbi:hypothetical protein [Streptomyces sp. SPB162]|uniref:hypothetical protein n=1 Tax=Streptomyces sp. SPB162 TaxID=2940560 RepID=UPI0024055E87|nr:hypothetical protein [Streptomyces sp. SPB162]